MWISSFVVTLPEQISAVDSICNALTSMGVFTLGDRQGRRLPVVLEAPDGSSARDLHEWVENLPGVVQVEVAFVSFDETSVFTEQHSGTS